MSRADECFFTLRTPPAVEDCSTARGCAIHRLRSGAAGWAFLGVARHKHLAAIAHACWLQSQRFVERGLAKRRLAVRKIPTGCATDITITRRVAGSGEISVARISVACEAIIEATFALVAEAAFTTTLTTTISTTGVTRATKVLC